MKAWRDLKVRTKIFALVAAGCLGLVVLGAMALNNMRALSNSVKEANTGMERVAGFSGMKSDFLADAAGARLHARHERCGKDCR